MGRWTHITGVIGLTLKDLKVEGLERYVENRREDSCPEDYYNLNADRVFDSVFNPVLPSWLKNGDKEFTFVPRIEYGDGSFGNAVIPFKEIACPFQKINENTYPTEGIEWRCTYTPQGRCGNNLVLTYIGSFEGGMDMKELREWIEKIRDLFHVNKILFEIEDNEAAKPSEIISIGL